MTVPHLHRSTQINTQLSDMQRDLHQIRSVLLPFTAAAIEEGAVGGALLRAAGFECAHHQVQGICAQERHHRRLVRGPVHSNARGTEDTPNGL